MNLNIYVIHDNAANKYNTPFFVLNDKIATRMFSDLVMDPLSDVHKHPTDFTLFKIGEYDDGNAELTYHEPSSINRAHELKSVLEIKAQLKVPEDVSNT